MSDISFKLIHVMVQHLMIQNGKLYLNKRSNSALRYMNFEGMLMGRV